MRGTSAYELVLAVAEHFGETVLAVADDDSTVRIVGLDGSPPRSVQVNFPIRCLALTWIDGHPIIAAANDSDRMLGTASYVTIRQPAASSVTSDGRVLPDHRGRVLGEPPSRRAG